MSANGLKAYIARAKYLLELQPKRDLDIIQINLLSDYFITKSGVDIESIGDFNIEHAKF
jgi:hypothetical protein